MIFNPRVAVSLRSGTETSDYVIEMRVNATEIAGVALVERISGLASHVIFQLGSQLFDFFVDLLTSLLIFRGCGVLTF